MNKKAHYQTVTVPTLFVTKDKQRVKQHINNVIYLNDGDEFELELFNPTSNKVLAKISLNDHDLGSGIVLRPGERVYLERYLDEARKFIFETYEVDKSDPNVRKAIEDNGKVEVEFYQENTGPNIWVSNTYTYPNYNPPSWTVEPSFYYCGGNTTTIGSSNASFDGNATLTSYGSSAAYSCDCNTGGDMARSAKKTKSIQPATQETGRIEMGANSNQMLEFDNTKFYSYPSWTSKWTILPKSQKAYMKEDLGVHCTGCGAKRKKGSHKFCPHCGNQF